MHLNVTTTSGCRGRCVYCPQDRFWDAMTERPRFLTAAEFGELVPNLEGTHFESISFGGFSEPFDNPEIVELLTIAHGLDFVDEVAVYSNGEAMTPARMRELTGVRFGTVDVSCHGFEPETYRRTRSFIDPAAVRENVLFLLENHSNIANLTISVSGPFGSEESLDELAELCAASIRSARRAYVYSSDVDRAPAARSARSAGLRRVSSMAEAAARASPGATSLPLTPSCTISSMPGSRVATTGSPQARYSTSLRGDANSARERVRG